MCFVYARQYTVTGLSGLPGEGYQAPLHTREKRHGSSGKKSRGKHKSYTQKKIFVYSRTAASIGLPLICFLYDRKMQFVQLFLVDFAGAFMRGSASRSPAGREEWIVMVARELRSR